MTFKWFICKIPIILLIQCPLVLLSSWHTAVLLLHYYRLCQQCLSFFTVGWFVALFLQIMGTARGSDCICICAAVVYSFKVKRWFSVSHFKIVIASAAIEILVKPLWKHFRAVVQPFLLLIPQYLNGFLWVFISCLAKECFPLKDCFVSLIFKGPMK